MIDPERFNPLKVLRWQETIAGAIQGRRVGPVRANLDLTNLCNHNCEWCEPLEYREHSIEESKHTLQTNVALDAIEDLGMLGTKAVFLSGSGEPTLHKQFATIVRACRERGMRVLVTTNGSRLHLLQTVFAESVDAFRVSLDASTEAEHMAIHGSKAGEFEQILESIRALVLERKTKKPEIGIAYTLESRNVSGESVKRMMGIAEDCGVDYLQFRPVSNREVDLDGLFQWIEIWKSRLAPGVTVLASDFRSNDVLYQRKFKQCYAALTVAVIGANGDVSACCDERQIVFGNLYYQRFRDIWLSSEHRERAELIEPGMCQRCLMCGYNKAVQDYVVENKLELEFV